jgi:predicted O-methyltransferase YrrM
MQEERVEPEGTKPVAEAVAEVAAPVDDRPVMDPWLRNAARRAKGFFPDDEGLALYRAALEGADIGPLVEIGSYCGKSTIYLGAAARDKGTVVYAVDHHRGSEEHQPGEQYHDPELVDASGRVDSFGEFRKTIEGSDVADCVIAIVADSELVAAHWATPVGFVLIDGGHSSKAADADYTGWTDHIAPGGLLAIHDVFEDPADGGQAPFEIYRRALVSRSFEEHSQQGSLRVLRKKKSVD